MLPVTVTNSYNSARKLRRQHGFQLPLHPLQVFGWLLLAGLSSAAFLVLVPALPIYLQSAVSLSLICLIFLHLAAHLTAALADPAEKALRLLVPQPIPTLDRTKHLHVIENGFCNLCSINISGPQTKHCSACNKCVAGFDHHCKWLNHCVGSRNYTAFLMCITSAIIAALAISILAFSELVYHKFNMISFVDFTSNSTSTRPSSLPTSDATFFAAVGLIGVLAAIATGLLLHLCFFHIYISFLGLTTYEYIRRQKHITDISTHDTNRQSDQDTCIHHSSLSLRHRPVDLKCENRSSRITLVTCSVVEETFTCKEPMSPSKRKCHTCLNNKVVPEITLEKSPKKIKSKWSCCSGVPDSPDETISPNEPMCLLSLCKHKIKKKNNSAEGRQPKTHGHWSSAKLRMLIRVIGNIGQNNKRLHLGQVQQNTKSNQISPSPVTNGGGSNTVVQTVNNLVPIPCYPDVSKKSNALPALPRFPKRRLISELEAVNAITALQLQQQQQLCQQRKLYVQHNRRRRSTVHRPKTPALSPIRESGLSNPASPSRQCSITGA